MNEYKPIHELTNEELLKELPICNIGQLTKKQQSFLDRQAKKGNINKLKWYWTSTIGNKKSWYYPKESAIL